ncbi:MAG: helix-turn-helix transcriptional regulator [Chitinophagaceae bacterium]|nr:helix-turn-helix transcriptional regulator [Chitinophagaceae bacterium]
MNNQSVDSIALCRADIEKLQEVKTYIDINLHEVLTISTLASRFSLSETTLRRHFIFYYRLPVYRYIFRCRMKKAKELLANGSLHLPEVATAVGYKRYTSFLHAFTSYYGVAPSRYQY